MIVRLISHSATVFLLFIVSASFAPRSVFAVVPTISIGLFVVGSTGGLALSSLAFWATGYLEKDEELAVIREDAAAFIVNGGVNPTPLLEAQILDIRQQRKAKEVQIETSDLEIAKSILKASTPEEQPQNLSRKSPQ